MDDDFKKILYSKNVLEFTTVANEYCKFVEDVNNVDRNKFIDVSLKLLPLLYLKTSLLPELQSDEEGIIEKFVSETDYNYLRENVAAKLGIHDIEITVSGEPDVEVTESEDVYLSECFSDIYQDIKNFTEVFRHENDTAMHEALWECTYNFKHYWGGRLLSLITTLHQMYYGDNDLSDNYKYSEEQNQYEEKNNWINNFFNQN